MPDFTPGEVPCPTCGRDYLRDFVWKKQCLKCYLKTKPDIPPQVRTVMVTEPIPADMLKRLVYLTHPDKHGNSEASNVATRYLLQLREVAVK